MPLHVTVIPASTQAGNQTIRTLLHSMNKPIVHGIYRNPEKAPKEFTENANFHISQGDAYAGLGLDFGRSDAVFYVPPPPLDGTETGVFAKTAAEYIKEAIQKAPNVKKLVLFSSMGAQYDNSIGVLRINHISDTILKNAASQVIVVKSGYFQENWAHAFETIQNDPPVIYSAITPVDHKIPMVSTKDVGESCARALLCETSEPGTQYLDLFGPQHYSSLDVKAAVEEITGKEVQLVAIEKDDLAGFFAQQVPEAYVQDFVDMTASALPGGVMAGDFEYTDKTVKGKFELVGALREVYKTTKD